MSETSAKSIRAAREAKAKRLAKKEAASGL
jgi:hypothetical protein